MKEDKKVKNILQKYMQWPLVLSILVVCGNVAAVLVSPQAGALMAVFTVLYLGCAVFLFWYGRKRLAAGLISYAAEFTGSQKQLLASMEAALRDRRYGRKNSLDEPGVCRRGEGGKKRQEKPAGPVS